MVPCPVCKRPMVRVNVGYMCDECTRMHYHGVLVKEMLSDQKP